MLYLMQASLYGGFAAILAVCCVLPLVSVVVVNAVKLIRYFNNNF